MTATNEERDKVVADEFREATAKMTLRERALVDCIYAAVGEIHEAIEFLEPIMDEHLEGFNAVHALLAGEVARRLANAAQQAVGVHAAVVGDILGPTVQ
ncbi:MAG: hypothetical protein NTY41_18550 [Proteobacteria bacterium]|nr:hypothetical protein [Pseudomonadota bacterium]